VLAIGAAFVVMVRDFLIAVMMAALFTALLYPVYSRIVSACRGRRAVASAIMLLLVVVAVGLPLLALLGVVTAEALQFSKAVRPWIDAQVQSQSGVSARLPDWVPFADAIEPYRSQILTKLGEFAAAAGQFLIRSVSAVTRGTVNFALDVFIFLYSMFFFFISGPQLLQALLQYIPLREQDRELILRRGVSVTRATLKGILVIGITQGVLVGFAFWATGMQGPAFWGTVVVVLSAIPGLGAPIVWVPATVILVISGDHGAAIGLALWCALVVGTVDNILRPHIVGGDTKMPDLLVLLSTLGGIVMFGAIGIIVGPVLAGVLITALGIYREAFTDQLPHARNLSTGTKKKAPRRSAGKKT
jgi:predicted PurR-regulated permease PerM